MGHGSLRMYTRQTHDSGNRRLRRARYSPQCARGNRRRRLRRAFAYPGSIDSADPRRPRHDRPGADRYRQDRRVRPAAAVAHRPEPSRAADAGAGADPRAGPAGRHRLRNLFQAIAGRRRGRRLRRRAHGAAAEGPAPGRTDPRRYPRPPVRPPAPRREAAGHRPAPGARRSRRDAQARLHGRPGSDLRGASRIAPDRALLGDPAGVHPWHRRAPPEAAQARQDRRQDPDRGRST